MLRCRSIKYRSLEKNSEMHSPESQNDRVAFAPLKPKRRSKIEQHAAGYAPVLLNARLELKRERARITRSGHPNVQWRRVTSPAQFSELLPARSKSPLLARVVDKVKQRPARRANNQSIWSLLRGWVLAFR
jgi:hypothetical protein